MSFLAVGLSHRRTPVDVLERAAVTPAELDGALADCLASELVSEAMILSTCNRVEVYAHVTKFHGGLDSIVQWLSQRMRLSAEDLADYLEVEYDEEAVRHMMRVASGLESLVVGEPQILGQLRTAYLEAADRDAVGRRLHGLAQHALRVGKRVQHDLGLAEVGRNLASVAIDLATKDEGSLAGRSAVVVGAGAMASLAASSLRTAGIDRLEIVNRTADRAAALAAKYAATATAMDELTSAIARADIVVSALGSSGGLIDADRFGESAGHTVVIDLALPKNVTDAAAALPGVDYIGLAEIQRRADELDVAVDGTQAAAVISEEVGAFLAKQRSAAAAPAIAALRDRAREVVEAEVRRLKNRIPDVDDRALGEIEYAIDRIVDKMLHAPSVRVRESAGTPSGEVYADALRALFDVAGQTTAPTGAVSDVIKRSVDDFQRAQDRPKPEAGS